VFHNIEIQYLDDTQDYFTWSEYVSLSRQITLPQNVVDDIH